MYKMKSNLVMYEIKDEEKAEMLPTKAEQDLTDFDPKYPFGNPSIIPKFWEEVRDEYNAGKNGLSASEAQRKIRLMYLKQSISKNEDILVHLLKVIPCKFKHVVNTDVKYTNLVFEINEFVAVILEEDSKKERRERKYDKLLKIGSIRRTILHLAAEQDLDMVVETILLFYPSLVSVTTNIGGFNDNPLCIALCKFYDRTASLLVKSMDSYSVRCLFETSESVEARFLLKNYIDPEDVSMKLTVLAILEKLMNPYWPFQPINQAEKEIEWYDMPKAPLSHHFYFQLLDGDDKGNAPGKNNKAFNYRSKSCLHLIAHSSSCREAIQHPVVRLLVKRKWNDYGQNIMRVYAGLYLIFIALFSCALFLQPSTQKIYIFRTFCEVATVLFTVFYILLELDEGDKRWVIYFSDFTNYIDLFGLVTILLIIPFRFAKLFQIEWIISAVAYFVNCLRLFQYFIVIKELHIYYRTFHIIIVEDIKKFAALFMVIMLAFTGSVYMALKSTTELNVVGGYWGIFFKEIRGLTESQGFSDDYSNINVVVVIFLMCNMFCTMVVLLNILIGQISNRYNEVQTMAKVQYDIDKTKFITKIDNSRLCGKFRIQYYKNGGYTTSSLEEDEVIADWVAMKEKEFLKEDNKKKFESMRGNLKLKEANACQRGLLQIPFTACDVISSEKKLPSTVYWIEKMHHSDYLKPRLFIPYFNEVKLIYEEQMVVKENSCDYSIPSTPEIRLSVSNATSDATSDERHSMPLLDIFKLSEDVIKNMVTREKELMSCEQVLKYLTLAPDNVEIIAEIQLRVVREFDYPDELANEIFQQYPDLVEDFTNTSMKRRTMSMVSHTKPLFCKSISESNSEIIRSSANTDLDEIAVDYRERLDNENQTNCLQILNQSSLVDECPLDLPMKEILN